MDLLREYVQSVVSELKRDERFIAKLKGRGARPDASTYGKKVAGDWLAQLEMELGQPVKRAVNKAVMDFVRSRWSGLLKRYGGDQGVATQALLALLDTKFSSLRLG